VTLVGVDIGSSAVKAAAFDVAGRQLRLVRIECASGGEFDPECWWRAVRDALTAIADSSVQAIGICGRGGTNVLLDDKWKVCGPSWEDGRARETARQLRHSFAQLTPQSLGLLAKARWWRDQGNAAVTVCSAKDYAVFRLTGTLVSDEASGGVVGAGQPNELLAARAPWALAGLSVGDGGIPAGLPVAVGWHDGAAATFGTGAARAGTASVTLGTNAVYRVVALQLPPGLRKYWDLTPGLTVTGGDILAAGRTFAWARALFPDADASTADVGAGGVLFVPQTQGRIAPDVRLEARGAWAGIGAETTRHELMRAVLEGVAFALRQVRDWLADEGLLATATFATGGGARSAIQAQILADVLQQPVRVATFEEGCRGAALLGGVAAGLLALEDAAQAPAAGVTFGPGPSVRARYDDGFARWIALQRAADQVWP
jgi:xylulokinase